MARVPKFTRGINCCINFFLIYFFPNSSLYCDFTENVYELPLLPIILPVKHILHKSGGVRSVDWVFIIWGAGLVVTMDKKLKSSF
jgi:hypothetical protein